MAKFTFKVLLNQRNDPFISAERLDGESDILKGWLTFDLIRGTSEEKAIGLASDMRQYIRELHLKPGSEPQ